MFDGRIWKEVKDNSQSDASQYYKKHLRFLILESLFWLQSGEIQDDLLLRILLRDLQAKFS